MRTYHKVGFRRKPEPKEALPVPGYEWVCRSCGEPCKVTRQDIGPYEGREVFMDYRSDCCSALYDEQLIEE